MFFQNLRQSFKKFGSNLFIEGRSKYIRLSRSTSKLHGFNHILSKKVSTNLLVVPTEAFGSLLFDYCEPNFDILTYSYDLPTYEASKLFPYKSHQVEHLAFQSEFFGESLKYIIKKLQAYAKYDQFLILNGDVIISWRDINTCFSMASMHSLDLFQPSLSLDSFYSHEHLLNKPGYFLEQVDFTEVMMLGLSRRLLEEWYKSNIFNISGWGIDIYLLPQLVSDNQFNPASVVHASIAKHAKPVESPDRIFSNNKTPRIELNEIKDALNL